MSLNASRNSGEPVPAAVRYQAAGRNASAGRCLCRGVGDRWCERAAGFARSRSLPDAGSDIASGSGRISTSLGITRVGEITGLDSLGIPVALATRPNSFSLSVNLGKGRDAASARASAAMEAAEIAIAERLPEDGITGSPSEIALVGTRGSRSRPHCAMPAAPARSRRTAFVGEGP